MDAMSLGTLEHKEVLWQKTQSCILKCDSETQPGLASRLYVTESGWSHWSDIEWSLPMRCWTSLSLRSMKESVSCWMSLSMRALSFCRTPGQHWMGHLLSQTHRPGGFV